MRKSVGIIPNYISASNPKGLRRLMIKTQVRLGYGVNFFDIQKVGNKWFAWYESNENITSHNIEEKLGDN